ncbi:MAG: TIM barrel protein [Thermoplasmata archaeon]
MFYLGPAGHPLDSKGMEDGLSMLKEAGLNAMEVQYTYGIQTKLETAERLGKLAKENGIRISCHAPYYINLNSRDKGVLKRSRSWIHRTAEMMDAWGGYMLVHHPGFLHGMKPSIVIKNVRTRLAGCVKRIRDEGWDVLIGLELTGKLTGFGTLDEVIKICQEVRGVYPVIDWAHTHARDQGLFKRVRDFENYLQKYEEFTTDFLHCHFSCIEYGERGEKKHLAIEAKSPDFSKLARVLKKREYDITIISESPVLDKDSLKMKEILGV